MAEATLKLKQGIKEKRCRLRKKIEALLRRFKHGGN